MLFLIAFLAGAILTVFQSNQAKVLALKTYYHLFEQQKQTKLKTLNMLEIAKKEKELGFWLSVFGPQTVMEELLTDAGGGTTLDCHQQAHLIGRVSYDLFGASIFGRGNSLCHSGYYHGAMEGFLREKGTVNIASNMTDLCQSFPNNFGQFECYHGVGHGVLAFEDYDLPMAIKLCQTLPSSFSKDSCFGGVFMENIVTANGQGADPGHKTDWITNDPHFPCNSPLFKDAIDIKRQCYHMQTSRMLMLYDNNFDMVLKECLRSPLDMQKSCFRSFGRDAAGVVLRNPSQIVALCGKIENGVFVEECMLGALNVVIDFWGERLTSQASQFCQNLTQTYKNSCYQTLADRLPSLFKDKNRRQAVCKTFESNYQNLCQN